ncbi:MAG: protein-glutamate O-methyltransferase CheR [Hyphomonadaceae bacterium]
MNSQDFEFVASLLRMRSGIVLTPDKTYLLESRLGPLARKEGLPSIEDLVQVVRSRREERLIAQLVDVMTTNETFFFRDRTPFDILKDTVLPKLAQERRGSRIRLWCAACSTGQEPYSIAMMLDQSPQLTNGVPVEIVASDISDRCLERARQGLFTQFEVQRGLPIQMLMQYFTQQDDQWRISEKIRSRIGFRKQNLLESFMGLGRFDIILCRNVLIYFDTPTKAGILDKMAAQMNPGGSLLLGAAETVLGVTNNWQPNPERRGLYTVSQKGVKAA